jgi:prefoldin subunit 5
MVNVFWIIVAALAVACVTIMTYWILKEKQQAEEFGDMIERNQYLQRQNDHLNSEIAEVNLKYSGSLDTREKSYNDIYMECKRLQLELNSANEEIERLKSTNRVLSAINDNLKEAKDEKEEVKKETEEA